MFCAPVRAKDAMLGFCKREGNHLFKLCNPFAGRSMAVAVSAGAALIAWAIAMQRAICSTGYAWVVSPLFASSASSFPIPLFIGA